MLHPDTSRCHYHDTGHLPSKLATRKSREQRFPRDRDAQGLQPLYGTPAGRSPWNPIDLLTLRQLRSRLRLTPSEPPLQQTDHLPRLRRLDLTELRTTRKPRLPSRLDGETLPRSADRQKPAVPESQKGNHKRGHSTFPNKYNVPFSLPPSLMMKPCPSVHVGGSHFAANFLITCSGTGFLGFTQRTFDLNLRHGRTTDSHSIQSGNDGLPELHFENENRLSSSYSEA